MFNKEQNLEELNKMIGAIVDKQEVLPVDNEETDNVQLENEMNLI